jgi:hypothetical protein
MPKIRPIFPFLIVRAFKSFPDSGRCERKHFIFFYVQRAHTDTYISPKSKIAIRARLPIHLANVSGFQRRITRQAIISFSLNSHLPVEN